MEISQLRIKFLRQFMGSRTQKEFADEFSLDASYISQLLNGHRNMGEKAASKLETQLGLPSGALVNPRIEVAAEAETNNNKVVSFQPRRRHPDKGYVVISHLDVHASMGPGSASPSYVEVIRDMSVHLDWLQARGISYSSAENLAIITGDGDSMQGTFNNGDLLLVDRGITQIRTDAIYVFTLHGDLFIKRLQRMTKGLLRMISDNPIYPPIIIENDDLESLHIQARVLLVWNAKNM